MNVPNAENTDPVAKAKAKMLDRNEDARIKLEQERENHAMQIKAEAEAKISALAELLGSVPVAEQRRIRLESAIIMAARMGNLYGNEKQIQHDDMTLALAKYSITGIA